MGAKDGTFDGSCVGSIVTMIIGLSDGTFVGV